ncbi:unnamed protein product [Thlaspi arvense]|uniref:HMA domain-containing protein n=1 Tax=Thlaspi arvense TaxID=13288 RepID=A0AAU9RQQ8_THLAR|nr:unnamed protein product [Thlaspi arvense]
MEDLNFPICLLKMNLQCCQDLPSRVKRRLRRVKGVYAIIIDPAKGLVLVAGTAEPPALVKAVERTGQSAQIYGYEKDPTKAKTQFRPLLKRYATEEEEEPQDEPPPKPAEGDCPAPVRFGNMGPPPIACPVPVRGFGHPGLPMMPAYTLPRTMEPPGWLAPGPRPRLLTCSRPEVRPTKPPAPYPYDFYETKSYPASDSLFRYFSDDHAQPCTIM